MSPRHVSYDVGCRATCRRSFWPSCATPAEPPSTTKGVRLKELVGREFTIGAVRVRGIRLCEPCGHLEKLSGLADLKTLFKGRCGLRGLILVGGTIRVGDRVEALRSEGVEAGRPSV